MVPFKPDTEPVLCVIVAVFEEGSVDPGELRVAVSIQTSSIAEL